MVLTKGELEVMNIFWDSDVPLSRKDVINMPIERSWKDNSLFHIINGLLEKEVLIVVGMQSSGKVFGRTYAANITRETYMAAYMRSISHSDKVKFGGLFAALLKGTPLTNELLDELEQILADIRKNLPKS